MLDAGEEPGAEQGLAEADRAGVVGHRLARARRAVDGEAVPAIQLDPLQAAPAAHLGPLADHAGAGSASTTMAIVSPPSGAVRVQDSRLVVLDRRGLQVGVGPAPAPDGDGDLRAVEGDGATADLHGHGARAAVDHVVDAGAAAGVDPHAGARASNIRSWLRARRRLWPGPSILK